MIKLEAFIFGMAQGAEIILLPFILLIELIIGKHIERLN